MAQRTPGSLRRSEHQQRRRYFELRDAWSSATRSTHSIYDKVRGPQNCGAPRQAKQKNAKLWMGIERQFDSNICMIADGDGSRPSASWNHGRAEMEIFVLHEKCFDRVRLVRTCCQRRRVTPPPASCKISSASTPRGQLGHFQGRPTAKRVEASLLQFQTAPPANGNRFEPGALDQNIFRGERNYHFRAAMIPPMRGARAVPIGDHADV